MTWRLQRDRAALLLAVGRAVDHCDGPGGSAMGRNVGLMSSNQFDNLKPL